MQDWGKKKKKAVRVEPKQMAQCCWGHQNNSNVAWATHAPLGGVTLITVVILNHKKPLDFGNIPEDQSTEHPAASYMKIAQQDT